MVSWAIQIVVPFGLHSVVVRIVVVRVSWINGVVVVRLVLDQRIKPPITDEDVLELNLMRTGDVLRVLVKKVGVKDRPVVSCTRSAYVSHAIRKSEFLPP